MRRQWPVLLLAVSLLGNGLLLTLLWRGREAIAPIVVEVTLEANAPINSPTPAPATIAATPLPAMPRATRPAPLVSSRAAPLLSPTATAGAAIPSPTPQPLPSPLPPTATPEPSPSPTIAALGTDWLQYVNIFRASAGLPPLLENTLWSQDANLHSRYMVYSGDLGHDEQPGSAYTTSAGQIAGQSGNIAAGYLGAAPFQWAFNYWMSAPFHALPILDPQLAATGFAEYRDVSGAQPVAATLDVARGLGPLPDGIVYPLLYPGPGQETWVLRYSLPEFPEALSTCPGYQQPTGAPIILQLGDGRLTPHVTAVGLSRDGEYLASCHFDETTFTHPNEFRQRSARLILDQRDAIVIIPQQPLLPDATYAVRVDVNGATYTWNFRTVAGPPQ